MKAILPSAALLFCLAAPQGAASDQKIDFPAVLNEWKVGVAAPRAADVAPDTACYAGRVSCGQTVTGRVSVDSCDADGLYGVGYDFNGTAGQSITVSAVSNEFAMSIVLVDGRDGTPATALKRHDVYRIGETARFTHTLPFTGRYLILVTPGTRYTFGNYSMSVSCGSVGPDPCDKVQPLTVGQTTFGALAAGDCTYGDTFSDQYSFSATEGQPLRITLVPSFSPYVEVMMDDGSRGVWHQSDATQALVFTYWPERTGTHRLLVSSSTAGATGGYNVLVQPDATASPCRRRSVRK